MRPDEDSPKPPPRPSLLTAAQQAEADRHRILTRLEGGRTAHPALAARGRGRAVRYGAMAATALLLLAAGGWLGQRTTDEQVASAAAPDLPVEAAPPVAARTAPATAPASAPAPALIRDEAPAADPAPRQSLSEMLVAGAAPPPGADRPAAGVLSKALERPSPPAKTSPARTPPRQLARAAPAPAKKSAAKPAAPAANHAEDRDLALLTALLAHAQAAPARPQKAAGALQAQLDQCAKLAPDAAAACRTRTCKGRGAANPACQPARLAAKETP